MLNNYTLSYSEIPPVLYRCHVLTVGCCTTAHGENCDVHESIRLDSSAYRIIWVQKGSGRLFTEGKWWTFGDGSLLVLRPDETIEYEFSTNTGLEACWLAVHIAPLNVFDRVFRIPKAKLFNVSAPDNITACFRNIIDEASATLPDPLLLSLLTGTLLARMAGCITPLSPGNTAAVKDIGTIVQTIMDEITENYMLNTPISEYAAGVSINKGYLIECFKSATGLTPLQYRIRIRMEKAKVMLTETTMPIQEIAALIGYTDSLYFSKQFSSYSGMSPVAYRKQYQ